MDDTEIGFIFIDVVGQGKHEVFCVFGGHNDAALYLCLGHIGSYGNEVHEKFVAGVRDDSQIGIVAVGYLRSELYLDFFLFVLCHIGDVLKIDKI